MTKVKPPTRMQYYRAEARIGIDFAPNIYPCKKCGWPVIVGYCCTTCGDSNPSEEKDDD